MLDPTLRCADGPPATAADGTRLESSVKGPPQMSACRTWCVVAASAIGVCLLGCSAKNWHGLLAEKPPLVQSGLQPVPKQWREHTQGLPFVIGYRQGLELAQAQGKPAMMFVTTTWCGWCKRLSQESLNDAEVRDLLGNFVCVIVDGDTEQEAKTQLGVRESYPDIVFVSPHGERLSECSGYKPVNEFKPIVQAALQRVRNADQSEPVVLDDRQDVSTHASGL